MDFVLLMFSPDQSEPGGGAKVTGRGGASERLVALTSNARVRSRKVTLTVFDVFRQFLLFLRL